jgi:hypothetical protein
MTSDEELRIKARKRA